MVDIHGSISLFSFYNKYLHMLGKIEYIQYRYDIWSVNLGFSTRVVNNFPLLQQHTPLVFDENNYLFIFYNALNVSKQSQS